MGGSWLLRLHFILDPPAKPAQLVDRLHVRFLLQLEFSRRVHFVGIHVGLPPAAQINYGAMKGAV